MCGNSYFRLFPIKSQVFPRVKSNKERGNQLVILQMIREYCEKNSLSLAAFERKCGLGNGVVAEWGKGSKPNTESLLKIHEATGMSLMKMMKAIKESG